MTRTLYFGNLSYRTGNEELTALAAPYGTVHSARVAMDRETGRSRGFGFVEIDDAAADAAIAALNGREIDGRALTVNEARPRGERSPGRFGRSGDRAGGNERWGRSGDAYASR